jgi:flagellin
MTVINTNVKSLVAASALTVNERFLATAMEQLSTGKRINGAKDDAAGQAIASRMTTQIRGLDQAVRNANDAISLIQTADGALEEVSNMLQRMRELSVQYNNDVNSTDDQTAISTEFTALADEIDRINDETTWNGQDVFTDFSSASMQIGANNGDTITIEIDAVAITGAVGGLTALDTDIDTINTQRSELGAYINRLTYASNNSLNISQNTSASRSRIVDTDYAKVSAELARTQIVQQAATAMLAQANQSSQSVLALLK